MTTDPNRTCASCPSFLPPEDTARKFRKNIGAPMCGRYGWVLGKPDAKLNQVEKLQKHYAQGCPEYGSALPAEPASFNHWVTAPDMNARALTAEDNSDYPAKVNCTSCAMCVNFVPEYRVQSELGWSAGLCAAKGKLVMPTRLTYEARNCEFRFYGSNRSSTVGLNLLPEYEDAFAVGVNPINAYFKSKDSFVDPMDYETDKEVTAEDTSSGIRAWRIIRDPEGTGNEIYLPIYDKAHFSEPQWAKVPKTGDDEHPELYVDHNGAVYKCGVLWTQLDETPALWGQAGVGKTELFRHLAWLMCLPFERISITAETEIDDLVGKTMYTPEKGTFFHYGRLPLAWQTPCVICLDEPNVGPSEVWQSIRPLTDNSKQYVIDQNEGERIPRHDDCYFGMAMNPNWDPRNVGAAMIGDADARRLMHIFMDLPPAELEREIILNRVKIDGWELPVDRLDTIMEIAKDLRELSSVENQTLPITWGIAQQIKVARASRWFDLRTAYRMSIGDFLEPEAQKVLLDQVNAHVD